MAILKKLTIDDAQAVAGPSVITRNLDHYLVLTGDDIPAVSSAPACPAAVTMRQARLALLGAGKLAAVATAIHALPEPDRTAAQITWEYSADVERHNGLVAQLAPALGLTEAQIDALFNAAAAL